MSPPTPQPGLSIWLRNSRMSGGRGWGGTEVPAHGQGPGRTEGSGNRTAAAAWVLPAAPSIRRSRGQRLRKLPFNFLITLSLPAAQPASERCAQSSSYEPLSLRLEIGLITRAFQELLTLSPAPRDPHRVPTRPTSGPGAEVALGRPEFQTWPLRALAVCPWRSASTPQNLSFPIPRMEIKIAPILGIVRHQGNSLRKRFPQALSER